MLNLHEIVIVWKNIEKLKVEQSSLFFDYPMIVATIRRLPP